MHQLILVAHPNTQSFNHALATKAAETLRAQGHEVRLRDLYEPAFAPALSAADLAAFHGGSVPDDIRIEQELIAWSDVVTFVYPLWWTGLPAILKGYIDRVFAFGFAYTIGADGLEKLLTGKQAVLFTTHGTPADVYEQSGDYDAFAKTIDRGIFDFCGVSVVAHRHYGAVPRVTDDERRGYLEDVEKTLAVFA